jgi:hypothetical protein
MNNQTFWKILYGVCYFIMIAIVVIATASHLFKFCFYIYSGDTTIKYYAYHIIGIAIGSWCLFVEYKMSKTFKNQPN